MGNGTISWVGVISRKGFQLEWKILAIIFSVHSDSLDDNNGPNVYGHIAWL